MVVKLEDDKASVVASVVVESGDNVVIDTRNLEYIKKI